MSVKNAMTADFLRSAYGGESMAHMRYLIWADVAEKEKMPNIARLFRAIAYAELAHADNHFRALKDQVGDFSVTAGAVFGSGKTVENLQEAIDGELHEIEQMYPVYLETARLQKEKAAERAVHYALEAEKIHAELFKEAQEAAKKGNDLDIGPIYVCPVCGHTVKETFLKLPCMWREKEKYKHFTA